MSMSNNLTEQDIAATLPPATHSAPGQLWDRLTNRSRRAVEAGFEAAAERGETVATPAHLLLGILRDSEGSAARILSRLNVSIVDLRSELGTGLQRQGAARPAGSDMLLSDDARAAILKAEAVAGDGHVTTARLMMGLLSDPSSPIAVLLLNKGVDLGTLRVLAAEQHEEDAGFAALETAQLANLTLSQLFLRNQMKGRNLLRISDLSAGEIGLLFAVTEKLKARGQRAAADDEVAGMHRGKVLAMVFQKPSLRTRVTFEIGMTQLGGHAIHLGPDEIGVGERETPGDVARNLERWVNGIVARTFTHKMVEDLAANAAIPVINGLSDFEHPCQALADLFTLYERYGTLAGVTLAYVGDSNNVARSLAELAARTGVNMRIASPEGYHFDREFLDEVRTLGAPNGASIEATTDPRAAAAGADAVYTDVWASMGQEAEARKRHEDFKDFQLNGDLIALAKPNAAVMHCQPAHRGEEISADAMDSPNSVIFDEAENRLHVQKALLALTL
jgi:ornithine carbamoyltransferase